MKNLTIFANLIKKYWELEYKAPNEAAIDIAQIGQIRIGNKNRTVFKFGDCTQMDRYNGTVALLWSKMAFFKRA